MQLSATIPKGRPQGFWQGTGFVDIWEVWCLGQGIGLPLHLCSGIPRKNTVAELEFTSKRKKIYYESYKNIVLFNSMSSKVTWTSSSAVYRYTLFVFFNQPFINYNSIKESFFKMKQEKEHFLVIGSPLKYCTLPSPGGGVMLVSWVGDLCTSLCKCLRGPKFLPPKIAADKCLVI